MQNLYFERRTAKHEGIRVSLDNGDGTAVPIAHINGNDASFRGPVILLSLDAHVVYGLSHPKVISNLLKDGPQPLISTKELAHTVFEHGMKASVSKVKVGNNQFLTSLETFYRLEQSSGGFSFLKNHVLFTPRGSEIEIAIVDGQSVELPPNDKRITVDINRILNYYKLDIP